MQAWPVSDDAVMPHEGHVSGDVLFRGAGINTLVLRVLNACEQDLDKDVDDGKMRKIASDG